MAGELSWISTCCTGGTGKIGSAVVRTPAVGKYPALKEDRELMETIRAIQDGKAQGNPLQKLLHRLFPDACIFCKYALAAYRKYDEQQRQDIAQGKPPKYKRARIMDLWSLYGKKITRGWVYLGCGIVIAGVLLAFIVTGWAVQDLIKNTMFTFWVETAALGFFGLACMTASQLQYIRKIRLFLKLRRQSPRPVSQLDGLDDVSAAR